MPISSRAVGSAAAGVTSVASAAVNTNLLQSNVNRLGFAVFNESTAVLYLKCAANASVTSYTVQIAAGGYYEAPYNYVGQVDGLWATANGFARITEFA